MDIVKRLREISGIKKSFPMQGDDLEGQAADEIERLREALWDLEQYVSRADHFYLKPETLATLKEVE